MKVTAGINWILAPTQRFQASLAFFRDVMGLPVVEEGVPVTDTQFSRYAQIKLPNGVVLEIVEPKETCINFRGHCRGRQHGRAAEQPKSRA